MLKNSNNNFENKLNSDDVFILVSSNIIIFVVYTALVKKYYN